MDDKKLEAIMLSLNGISWHINVINRELCKLRERLEKPDAQEIYNEVDCL